MFLIFAGSNRNRQMHKGQRYTNGVDTFKITAVSKQGIKVTTERESDGAKMVFDWEGARGFVYRFDHKLPMGVLIND